MNKVLLASLVVFLIVSVAACSVYYLGMLGNAQSAACYRLQGGPSGDSICGGIGTNTSAFLAFFSAFEVVAITFAIFSLFYSPVVGEAVEAQFQPSSHLRAFTRKRMKIRRLELLEMLTELRKAGANNRFLDEVQDYLDRIGNQQLEAIYAKIRSIGRSSQQDERERICREICANGMEMKLFMHLGSWQQSSVVAGYSYGLTTHHGVDRWKHSTCHRSIASTRTHPTTYSLFRLPIKHRRLLIRDRKSKHVKSCTVPCFGAPRLSCEAAHMG